jgi:hypothetical protein
MGSNRSTSTAAYQPYVTSGVAGVRSACYLVTTCVTEVMLEQLRYLLSHKRPECPVDCPDCERLAGAQSWLLLPFRATATQGSIPPKDFSLAQNVSSARI